RCISVWAYNLSTILAEKLETIVSRGDQNTRPRDYYDVFILTKLKTNEIDLENLRAAFMATSEKRGSTELMKQFREIMRAVKKSDIMKQRWTNYGKDYDYAAGIEFEDTCDAVVTIMHGLFNK
ncbi:MAG: nucleotidyl transferase AbiEii/AbiGii toxin family protein, partial [Lachnospiraceae bacterium]|nr:nucleotidyl transferase AbiEii/AbiGii toxin family protein [Lachnospiraceae bacterium]